MTPPDFEVNETGSRAAMTEQGMEIEKLKSLLRDAIAVVDDFMPNIGVCALQDYGRLNQFMMDAEEYRE